MLTTLIDNSYLSVPLASMISLGAEAYGYCSEDFADNYTCDVDYHDSLQSSIDAFSAMESRPTLVSAETRLLDRESYDLALLNIVAKQFSDENIYKVIAFLKENSDLLEFVKKISTDLELESLIDLVRLDIKVDYDDDCKRIFIIVFCSLENFEEVIELENKIFDDYFCPNLELLQSRVILSVRENYGHYA